MRKRQSVKVSVIQKSVFGSVIGDGFSDDKASDVLAWLTKMLASIPAEYRDSARLNIGSACGYGEHRTDLELYYSRPETDEEMKDCRRKLPTA